MILQLVYSGWLDLECIRDRIVQNAMHNENYDI